MQRNFPLHSALIVFGMGLPSRILAAWVSNLRNRNLNAYEVIKNMMWQMLIQM